MVFVLTVVFLVINGWVYQNLDEIRVIRPLNTESKTVYATNGAKKKSYAIIKWIRKDIMVLDHFKNMEVRTVWIICKYLLTLN